MNFEKTKKYFFLFLFFLLFAPNSLALGPGDICVDDDECDIPLICSRNDCGAGQVCCPPSCSESDPCPTDGEFFASDRTRYPRYCIEDEGRCSRNGDPPPTATEPPPSGPTAPPPSSAVRCTIGDSECTGSTEVCVLVPSITGCALEPNRCCQNMPCTDSSGCPDVRSCSGGWCVKGWTAPVRENVPYDGECYSSSECLGGLACIANRCKYCTESGDNQASWDNNCYRVGDPRMSRCVVEGSEGLGRCGGESVSVASPAPPSPSPPQTPYVYEVTKPSLQIPLPTLGSFTNLVSTGEVGERYLLIPWIGEYIAAMYKYAIGITGVLAGIMIVVAGLIWLTAGGSAERISTAKSYIEGAMVGLVIALTSYVILYAVNPNLVGFEAMKVKFVERSEMDPLMSHELFQEDSSGMPASGSPVVASAGGVEPSTLIRVDVECLHTNAPVDPRWEESLKKVADRFCQLRGSNTGWKIVGGGYRPPADAVKFYVRRCLFRSSCTIPTGNPFTEGTIVVEGGKKVPSNASIRSLEGNENALINALMPFVKTDRPGHGSGLAFDAYCEREEATSRQTHLKPYVPCQLLLEQAFKENGFCRLNHENWHFELTSLKASRSCNENWTIGTLQKSSSAPLLDYRSCPQYWAWDSETCLDR